MKRTTFNILSVLTAALVMAASTGAQRGSTTPDRRAIVEAARTLIGKARYATFVTLDATGAPQSRLVEPLPVEDDFTVWIGTNDRSRKVTQVSADGRVTLLYLDAAAPGYVSLFGKAAIVRDPAEKARHWKDSWAGLYKDRNRGDDYTLIKVTSWRLEISSPSQGMNNDPVTWQPVTLTLIR